MTTQKQAGRSRIAALIAAGTLAALLSTASASYAQQGMEPAGGSVFDMQTQGLRIVERRVMNDAAAMDRKGVRAPVMVKFSGPQPVGSLVGDYRNQLVYLVQPNGEALEFIAVMGRSGHAMSPRTRFIYDKIANPAWYTPLGNGTYRETRGPGSTLGAYALPLALADTGDEGSYAFHGTDRDDLLRLPNGKRMLSNGCIRMANADIKFLADNLRLGTMVHIYNNGEVGNWIRRQQSSLPAWTVQVNGMPG